MALAPYVNVGIGSQDIGARGVGVVDVDSDKRAIWESELKWTVTESKEELRHENFSNSS